MYEVKSSVVLYSWELCERSVIIILGVGMEWRETWGLYGPGKQDMALVIPQM